jgi:hypothetical protein
LEQATRRKEDDEIMVSSTRAECIYQLGLCKDIVGVDYHSAIEVGTDGDELPSGNYRMFAHAGLLSWITVDHLPRLNPTIVFDLEKETWDQKNKVMLVICSNVLEHTKELSKAMDNVCAMTEDWLIIDMPNDWDTTPFHGTRDYGDWHRLHSTEITAMLGQRGFTTVFAKDGRCVSTILARRIA